MARRILPKFSSGPQNDGEARVINFLTENLPPQGIINNLNNMWTMGDEYIVIANFEIAYQKRYLEIDAIVVAPHCVYLVEVKDWWGKIKGDDNTWVLDNENIRDNPLKGLDLKCKIVKTLLINTIPDLQVNVQGIVVIAKNDTILDLKGVRAAEVFLLDQKLIDYLKSPEVLNRRSIYYKCISKFQEEIARVITNTAKEKNTKKIIQNHEIIEKLSFNEDCTEYIGKPIYGHSQSGVKKLRVLTLPVYLENSEKELHRQRILRNYHSLSSIGEHKNIVSTKGVFDHESSYLVEILDWSEQGTLRNLMDKVDINFDNTISIIRGIAEGLKLIHEKKIIHRALRPENILMSGNCPKLMNFDFAFIESNGEFKTVWQTSITNKNRQYLPLELSYSKDEYDFYESSDIYSLGVIFYELLCKKIPFEGPESLDRYNGFLPENLLPSKINPNLPVWLDEMINKMYTNQIDSRYVDINSFINDLDSKLNLSASNSKSNQDDPDRQFKENERVGDYRIIEHIKSGGFSHVYRALHIYQNMEYALKVYNLDVPISSLIDEFWLLNQLNHPNIVKVSWSGALIPDRFYIAMEYLKGLSLSSYIRGNKKLSTEEVLKVAKDIISALRYLHEKDSKSGVLEGKTFYHRDVKPANIIYVPDRGFVLIDFNVSKEGQDLLTFVGTSPYIAPDMVQGNKILWNESGDTFALGVTLYQLVCKQHPYSNNEPRINSKILNPSEIEESKGIDPKISDFILKAVQPLYENRFKTAKEMEDYLLDITNPKEIIEINKEEITNRDEIINKIDNSKDFNILYQENTENIEFKIYNGSFQLPTSIWNEINQIEILPKLLLLSEMVDNGQASLNPDSLTISYEDLSKLESNDLSKLGLPEFYPFKIKIDSDGILNEVEFKYKWGFFEHELGKQIYAKRIGNIIESENKKYSLTEDQFKLCNLLDKFNSLPDSEKNAHKNLLAFAEIKELANKAGAILDSYLKNENVFNPKSIDLDITLNSDETIDLNPEVDIEDKEQFTKRFNRNPRVQNTYTIENEEGERTRLIFSQEHEEELKKVKTLRKIKGESKDKLIENPQEFFNPDIIDLDKFSERVKAIGLYKPKFYPFITPYKSEWIPGFLIETSPEDRQRIEFKEKEDLESFKSCYQEAIKLEKNNMEWKEISIPTFEAEQVIKTAEMQFLDQSKPINTEKFNHKKVLIIKENIEELEHSTEVDPLISSKKNEFIHRFSKIPNLKENIEVLEHQKEGIAWLQSMFSDGYYGALLADDMGLGKTFQLLSFVQWHNQNINDNKPYLIIAPVSLLENWEAEFYKFFENSDLSFTKAYGSSIKTNDDKLDISIETLQKKHIVLTTYETMRKKQFTFCAVDWAVSILDEAQRIKTPGTLITNAVKALKSDFKIAATGTPVENTLVDLWCIMDFVMPGLLGSAKDFSNEFQNSLKKQDTDIKLLGESLRKKIGISLKRRMKKDILTGLPSKNIIPIQKIMPEIQLKKYKEQIAEKPYQDSIKNGSSMLRLIQLLRDISDHPFLPDKELDLYNTDELINSSAKLQQSIEILNSIKEKQEKVIIFADRREIQRLLARIVRDIYGISSSIINGETPSTAQRENSAKESRQQAVNKFQNKSGFNIIIMSPLAAGVGLNITKANHVIHYSRHWNPAKEDQATDRVYRIGQENDVYVYLPMATSNDFKTFDIILDELLEKKRSLASASLFPTERAEISQEELLSNIYSSFNKI